MPKLRILGHRVRSGSPRLKTLQKKPALSDDRMQRREMYASKQWRALRSDVRRRCPFCLICGDKTGQVDHLLGHDDQIARMLVEVYHIRGAAEDWRDRFWQSQFLIGLCHSCHSEKTSIEAEGKLGQWIEKNGATFGLPLLPSFGQRIQ